MWKIILLTCFFILPSLADIELTYWEPPNLAARLGEAYACSYVVAGEKWFTQVAIWIGPWNLFLTTVNGSFTSTNENHCPTSPVFGYFSGSIDPFLTTDWQFININPPIRVADPNFAIYISANYQQRSLMYDSTIPLELWHNWWQNYGWVHMTYGDWAIKAYYYLGPDETVIEPVSIGNIKASYH
jgi:hypothetical protein